MITNDTKVTLQLLSTFIHFILMQKKNLILTSISQSSLMRSEAKLILPQLDDSSSHSVRLTVVCLHPENGCVRITTNTSWLDFLSWWSMHVSRRVCVRACVWCLTSSVPLSSPAHFQYCIQKPGPGMPSYIPANFPYAWPPIHAHNFSECVESRHGSRWPYLFFLR